MLRKFWKRFMHSPVEEVVEYKKNSIVIGEEITTHELSELAEMLNLNIADLSDALDEAEIPRIEKNKDKVLLYLRIPAKTNSLLGIHTQTLTAVFSKKVFSLISYSNIEFVDKFIKKHSLNTRNNIEVLCELLSTINVLYTNHIKNLRAQVIELKSHTYLIQNTDIIKLTDIAETFDQYYSALVPMQKALEKLLQKDYITLESNELALIEDISNAFNQLSEICKINLKSIQSLRDAYQIIFTNKLNYKIHFLTVFTILMTIPTIIASIFGMNVDLPFDNKPWAFMFVIFLSLTLSSIIYIIFRIKRWI